LAGKFGEDVIGRLEQALTLGATYEMACRYAGITYQTYRNWILKGEQAKSGDFCDFVERMAAAEGRAVIGWLAKIERAANEGVWQAAAWKLERRYPEAYGRQRVELTGADGDVVRISIRWPEENQDGEQTNGTPD
jgi:hypothetical protein